MNGPEERAARTGLRVVVVDDDGELRDEVVTYLVLSGFQVAGARDGAGLDRLLAAGLCDIAVLDVGLPGESGIELARRLRDRPATGVVMLTGHDHIEDRLQGLRAGADAYLTKPVDLRELVATIDAVARRSLPAAGPAMPAERWSFDAVHWTLTAPGGTAITLTGVEYQFLSVLLRAPGAMVSRTTIAEAMGQARRNDFRHLDSLVRRLRRKVEAAAGLPLPVQAVHAVGYVFRGVADWNGPG